MDILTLEIWLQLFFLSTKWLSFMQMAHTGPFISSAPLFPPLPYIPNPFSWEITATVTSNGATFNEVPWPHAHH